jgi:hypothetical protein
LQGTARNFLEQAFTIMASSQLKFHHADCAAIRARTAARSRSFRMPIN